MFAKPSLITRIVIAKSIGFAFGLVGFFVAPAFGVDDLRIRIAVLFWYTTLGAFIGLAGVFTYHPVLKLKLKLPWWATGPLIAAQMNGLVVLFAWDAFASMMAGGAFWGLTSPAWFVVEGFAIGFVINAMATLFGGEGPETAARMAQPENAQTHFRFRNGVVAPKIPAGRSTNTQIGERYV